MNEPVTAITEGPGTKRKYIAIGLSVVLLLVGLIGFSNAALGYALFLIASLLLLAGLTMLGLFALTRWFDTHQLRRAYATAFWAGGWCYVLAVSALAGYFVHEALSGRIEWNYIIFGPVALAAIIILDIGIWRIIVERNLPTLQRFGDLWSRDNLDQTAMRKTLVDEVILHRTLLTVSPFRWIRHQLILWGFGLMFGVEVMAVAFREAFPSFGWTHLWDQPSHPIRLAFDLAYDLTGLMILVGCILALVFRVMAHGKPEQKYTDTPTVIFLLLVVLTGFLVEGSRLTSGSSYAGAGASFVGLMFAAISPTSKTAYDFLWITHAVAACGFIAYVPLKRLIHSCATPLGRLANSQVGILAAKKARVIGGLFNTQMKNRL